MNPNLLDWNPYIEAISVEDFKSLAGKSRIEVRPLTILAGANSSGKSSILQPLLLLKQTLEAPYDPGPLRLDGPNVRFTSAEQFLTKAKKQAANIFTMGLEIYGGYSKHTFQKRPEKNIELIHQEYNILGEDVTIQLDMELPEVEKLWREHYWFDETKNPHSLLDWNIIRHRYFLFLEVRFLEIATNFISSKLIGDDVEITGEAIKSTIHVPGLRGNPERTYRTAAVGSAFPGTFENYVASVISLWQAKADHRLNILQDSLQILGLTRVVEAKQVDETRVELRVGRSLTGGRTVNIADVGLGVSQVLPAIVALLIAEAGQLVYLEQPEIHLHPKAQIALAKVLADAANRGVRVVVETHSDLLLLGIQTLVAEGYIAPEEVILHWFKRRKSGATEITTAELDEAGAYGDWPEDFDIVNLKAHNRYISAAEARLMARENG